MNIEYHKWKSPALNQDMELKVYGHSGKAMIVFPSSSGRFFDYENNGMVNACSQFIKQGRLKLFTVDSADSQSWFNHSISPRQRADRHDEYEHYILKEVAPFIHDHCADSGKIMATGCSMGAFHAANFFFRYPETFDTVIALSGLYGSRYVLGDYMDDHLYFYFPLIYLPGNNEPLYINHYRKGKIILCVGQGDWERCGTYDCIGETQALKDILESKNIPCQAEFWGHDAAHDWLWWRKQINYFLEKL
ncbi:Putative esterase [Desulfonema limicola]|uniref:Esterase n=1 Tax=Desulfonema limicola TaxID=45656 RepID=A0A975B7X2_9BACT|nr:alpha/beta hydrolase-fold protein [Desulfonema limicola]QTA80333.1 Putative esterase [Desulfonema limicola]